MPFRELLVQNENTNIYSQFKCFEWTTPCVCRETQQGMPSPLRRTSYVLQLSFYMIYWPACDGIIG